MAGVAVDSWFTGFADTHGGIVYFSVYLGGRGGVQLKGKRNCLTDIVRTLTITVIRGITIYFPQLISQALIA